ncbi:hypothetical protein [Hyphomicrobium sp. ghe19]|uniref:hypothetical protein n=1 Tax=Hyphomicrobium sp. ghe19 TaxID=2682968 RepID=UPI001367238E|nr:hypothetical protein HYPP_02541 [Hyphomicrobium sp. ghe19]
MSDKVRDEVVNKLNELTNEFPDGGFVIVTVQETQGQEHIRTFSNLPDASVQYVAALIVENGEVVEKKTKKKRKLH